MHPGALLFLIAAVALWPGSYFEIRAETESGGRFLGYKAYLLFFYKLLMVPAFVLAAFGLSFVAKRAAYLILPLGVRRAVRRTRRRLFVEVRA